VWALEIGAQHYQNFKFLSILLCALLLDIPASRASGCGPFYSSVRVHNSLLRAQTEESPFTITEKEILKPRRTFLISVTEC